MAPMVTDDATFHSQLHPQFGLGKLRKSTTFQDKQANSEQVVD